jgi:RNA polymerase sigma-70 factor (ECF subfamily)
MRTMLTTSSSLLERLRQPAVNPQAWGRFVSLYAGLLYRWARRWGLQAADASDVVQEVLLVVYRELPAFEPTPEKRFRSWLWAITRNQVRRLRRQRFPGLASTDLSVEDDLLVLAPQAEHDAAAELALLTHRAAELFRDDFHPTTWKAFWETAVAGRRGKDVAQELGMSIGAVYAARFRVLHRIREELADFFD